jgi:hypothetical protein
MENFRLLEWPVSANNMLLRLTVLPCFGSSSFCSYVQGVAKGFSVVLFQEKVLNVLLLIFECWIEWQKASFERGCKTANFT